MIETDRIPEFLKKAAENFFGILLDQIQDGICVLDEEQRIVFWNRSAETITGYLRPEIIGKQLPDDFKLFVDHNGLPLNRNTPLEAGAAAEGATRTAATFMKHKGGYRLPVFLRILPIPDEQGRIIGTTVVFTGISPRIAIPMKANDLKSSTFIDEETGIANRDYLEMLLETRIDEYRKYDLGFGLLYVDLDNHAKILERFGRLNADKVIRTIALTLHKNIRYLDVAGRWGKDEFLIILHNIDEGHLDIVANKLRLLVSDVYFPMETGVLNVTVSMGACLAQRHDTAESLVKRGEQLMLHSKWLGRNKVSMSFCQKETV
jgi:diguanylate cyclase (GGDEF)-like protein/PAS domain S-box-containing protein